MSAEIRLPAERAAALLHALRDELIGGEVVLAQKAYVVKLLMFETPAGPATYDYEMNLVTGMPYGLVYAALPAAFCLAAGTANVGFIELPDEGCYTSPQPRSYAVGERLDPSRIVAGARAPSLDSEVLRLWLALRDDAIYRLYEQTVYPEVVLCRVGLRAGSGDATLMPTETHALILADGRPETATFVSRDGEVLFSTDVGVDGGIDLSATYVHGGGLFSLSEIQLL